MLFPQESKLKDETMLKKNQWCGLSWNPATSTGPCVSEQSIAKVAGNQRKGKRMIENTEEIL